MSRLVSVFGAVLWFAGALVSFVAPYIAAGTVILAAFGVAKWRSPRWVLAYCVPLLSSIVLYSVVLNVPMANLEPPFYMGLWAVFLAVYTFGLLAIAPRREPRGA